MHDFIDPVCNYVIMPCIIDSLQIAYHFQEITHNIKMYGLGAPPEHSVHG